MRRTDKLKNIELANRKVLNESEGEEGEEMSIYDRAREERKDRNGVEDIFYDIDMDIEQLQPNEIEDYIEEIMNHCYGILDEHDLG